MEQVYMPLKEYYDKYLKLAKENNFIWVLSLLSREADTKKVYQDIEKKWASINDLTSNRILFVFSSNDIEESTVLPTKECSWKGYTNPFIKVFRNEKIKTHEYKYDANKVHKSPKTNFADLHSQSISGMIRFLGISESDIPCLILTNLLTNKKFIVRISDTFDVYEFIKNFVINQEKILLKYDDIIYNNYNLEVINGYYKYLELVDELNKISNESEDCTKRAIQHILDGKPYKEIKISVENKYLREKLKKHKQWKRQFYDKYISNEDYYIKANEELRTTCENMDNILIEMNASELLSRSQIEEKRLKILEEKLPIGDMKRDQCYIFVADGWGAKYGGINTVNYNFCIALAKSNQADVICITRQINRQEIKNAEEIGVKLISMHEEDFKNSKVICAELRESGILRGDLKKNIVWIGHDIKTGEIASQCKREFGHKFILFHHMDYEEYYGIKVPYQNDEYQIKRKQQKNLCNIADAIIAIGPKLYSSAIRKTEKDKVHMIIPGLEEISVGRHTENKHKAITFGRVEKENDIIKQTTLAVCAYAQAYKTRRSELFDNLGYIEVIGYDEKLTEEQINELRKLGNKYAGCALSINGMKYQEERNELFGFLQDSGFCMMLSLVEGFGLVGLEAISAGLPLICSKNSGLYEFLDSEEMSMGGNVIVIDILGNMGEINEMFFNEEDLDNVTKAIIQLLSKYDRYLSKATALKEKWQNIFTWERAVKEFLLASKL